MNPLHAVQTALYRPKRQRNLTVLKKPVQKLAGERPKILILEAPDLSQLVCKVGDFTPRCARRRNKRHNSLA
jgi:hypothetical protein